MFHTRQNHSFFSSILLGAGLTLSIALGACTKDTETKSPAGEQEAATAKTQEAAAPKAAGEAGDVQAAMSEVLSHYEVVHGLLVEDKGAEVGAAAQKLQAAAQKAEAAAPAAGKPHLAAMATHAQAMAGLPAGDLDKMRTTFGEVSKPLVALMEEMPAMAKGLHLFECPMAEGYNRWVQKDATLANPYMGTSMPECGSEKQWAHHGDEGHHHGDEGHHHGDEAHHHDDHDDHAGH